MLSSSGLTAGVAFADTCLTVTNSLDDRISARVLWGQYRCFCVDVGLPLGSRSEFSGVLTAIGARRIKSNGRIVYACLAWRHDVRTRSASPSLTAKLLRVTENLFEKRTLSISEFCRAYGLGRNTYYRMERAGRGPRTMWIGAAKRIHVDAAEEWARRVEREPITFH
jgi:predicted DNA-binding transcriptional regulator AlpA